MIKTSLAAAAATVALLGAAPAGAVTFVFTPGSNVAGVGFSPQTGYHVINDFNNASDLTGITGNNFELHPAGSDGDGAQPFFSSPGNTSYLSVLGGTQADPGLANYTFASPLDTSFQFDWGSIDSYNTLTIHLASGPDFVIVPGGNFPNAANGNQSESATNGVFTVFAGTGESITGFSLGSTQNSFEIDNLAVPGGVRNGVPEPAAWTLMIAGFGLAGAMFRRRRAMVAA